MTNFFNAYMKEEMTIEEAYASVVHMRSKLDVIMKVMWLKWLRLSIYWLCVI